MIGRLLQWLTVSKYYSEGHRGNEVYCMLMSSDTLKRITAELGDGKGSRVRPSGLESIAGVLALTSEDVPDGEVAFCEITSVLRLDEEAEE